MPLGKRAKTDFLKPYRDALAEHGPGFLATLWNSPFAQRLRFDIMIDAADLSGCTILDAGSGTGDFAAHLLKRGIEFSRYIGIDGLPEQIQAARERHLERCEFHASDFIRSPESIGQHQPDWVCFSGSLNNMDDATVTHILRAAYDAASRGIMFNFLSDRGEPADMRTNPAPARRFDTLSMIDFALTLSHRVQFRQDYLDGHDATIIVERPV